MGPILGLGVHLGRGVQRIATDAIAGRVRSLPRTIGDLDATTLSGLLDWQGALYADVTAWRRGTRRSRHGRVAWEVTVIDHLGSSRPND
jgi:hypothetical protein